ncbi:hypothetical protein [Nocardia wallacei]|uniref:hypothetical protein n=1 Tax=Nocardia wallacei TaxID=480035 RepID=UPI002455C6F6|nr:hypothetical protein [Nocardia wallacei]
MAKTTVVDAIVIHTVRGDLDVLTGFAAEQQVTEGYRATKPWAAGEHRWALELWRSTACGLGRTEIEDRCAQLGLVYVRQDIEHVMRDTLSHDDRGALKPGARLPGGAYVTVVCNETGEIGKVLVVEPNWCNHGITICRECAESWETDHTVRYTNTEGGRALFAQGRGTAKIR